MKLKSSSSDRIATTSRDRFYSNQRSPSHLRHKNVKIKKNVIAMTVNYGSKGSLKGLSRKCLRITSLNLCALCGTLMCYIYWRSEVLCLHLTTVHYIRVLLSSIQRNIRGFCCGDCIFLPDTLVSQSQWHPKLQPPLVFPMPSSSSSALEEYTRHSCITERFKRMSFTIKLPMDRSSRLPGSYKHSVCGLNYCNLTVDDSIIDHRL